MSKEFEDYYNGIVEIVKQKLPNPKYADNISRKNYFRIKTGFYEDELPNDVVKDVLFSVNETVLKKNISESLLHEKSGTDGPVREVVKDITKIIKQGIRGEFYLPEEFNEDRMSYEFDSLPTFSIILNLTYDSSLDSQYYMNADVDEESLIVMDLIINPSNYPQSLYNIIGDLNETIRHEIEHILQDAGRRPDDEVYMGGKIPTDKEYYKQPHEVPAEIKGFRRLVKLRKSSPEKVIKDWFIRNQNVHGLSDEDINELTDFLVEKYKEYYGRKN